MGGARRRPGHSWSATVMAASLALHKWAIRHIPTIAHQISPRGGTGGAAFLNPAREAFRIWLRLPKAKGTAAITDLVAMRRLFAPEVSGKKTTD